jgi:predicted RNA binding protein YcfA (HicA-like mRNA interferase family)
MKKQKLFKKLIKGSQNIHFNDLISIVEAFGFELSRTKGSHHIYVHKDVDELINLQNVNGKAKPYQIKQFLELIEKHNIKMED